MTGGGFGGGQPPSSTAVYYWVPYYSYYPYCGGYYVSGYYAVTYAPAAPAPAPAAQQRGTPPGRPPARLPRQPRTGDIEGVPPPDVQGEVPPVPPPLGPRDADAIFWRGYELYWAGRYEEALELFDEAVEARGDDARYWYYRALTEKVLGIADEAAESVKQAIELRRLGKPGLDLIGLALERVQGPDRAFINGRVTVRVRR
jgi:tetratricopeptide (TPR) repeat protein